MSISQNNNININNEQSKLNEFNSIFEKASIMLFKLDDIFLENKDYLIQNIENIIINIQTNLNDLLLDENNFKKRSLEINQNIEVMNVIIKDFETSENRFNSKNNEIEKEIAKLKNIQNQCINLDQKNISNNNINNNTNDINNKNQNNNNNNTNNELRKKIIEQSFLYNVKDVSKKLELYKTINLFKNNNEVERNPLFTEIVKSNYHEICYVYDDYEIFDIYYTHKIFGQNNFLITYCIFVTLPFGNNYEIQEFSLDDIPIEYTLMGNLLSYKIKLKNMQSSKVHIKGKSIRKLINYTGKENEINKIYRYGNYGLGSELSGVNAKYSLILKGSFDIVNFDEYFLIRNFNNKNDIEYFWGGIVPPEGKQTKIMFSKKEATWSFSQEISFFHYNFLKGENSIIYAPIEYIGGNNEIININQSPKKNFIKIDEENRRFIIELDKNLTTLKFNVNGELKNKCKGEWNVNLTDEEVDKLMPKEDIKCKDQLKIIAKKIINDFDKEHKNSDFEFLDYMKIGFWVHKNIKYDMNYSGKKMSAMEIYNLKKGVYVIILLY